MFIILWYNNYNKFKEKRKMTEEEKIFAGKMFDPRKKELKDIKQFMRAWGD